MTVWVSIADGSKYPGRIPTKVSIAVTTMAEDNGNRYSELITASQGDKNWDRVLETWMFEHGYIAEEKAKEVDDDIDD